MGGGFERLLGATVEYFWGNEINLHNVDLAGIKPATTLFRGWRDIKTLTVFYTGDFHNRLGGSGAEKIKALKEEIEDALLVDTGDAVGAGNIFFRPFGEPILERMSQTGYEAMALGNREFHFRKRILELKIRQGQFPVLCANLVGKKGNPAGVKPYIIKELKGGFRIVLLGLTVPLITSEMWWCRWISDFVFIDPLEAVEKYIREFQLAADFLIVLSHLGLKGDERVAQQSQYIPLIIGGHSHKIFEEPLKVKETYIIQSGEYANYLGRLNLGIENGQIVDLENRLIPL